MADHRAEPARGGRGDRCPDDADACRLHVQLEDLPARRRTPASAEPTTTRSRPTPSRQATSAPTSRSSTSPSVIGAPAGPGSVCLPDSRCRSRATSRTTSNMMTITATGGDPQLVARVATEAGPVLADVAKKFSPLLASNGQAVEADDHRCRPLSRLTPRHPTPSATSCSARSLGLALGHRPRAAPAHPGHQGAHGGGHQGAVDAADPRRHPDGEVGQERPARARQRPARTACGVDPPPAHQHPLRRCHDRWALVRRHLVGAR